jgi:hypothetical protein
MEVRRQEHWNHSTLQCKQTFISFFFQLKNRFK